MSDHNNNKILPKSSCKLINQPLIRFGGPSSYSFTYFDPLKTGFYNNIRSSGIFFGDECLQTSQHYQESNDNFYLRTSKFVSEKKKIDQVKDIIRLPVADVDSVKQFLTQLVQQLCKTGTHDEDGDEISVSAKFSDISIFAATGNGHESYDFYQCKLWNDLPKELKEQPVHPSHLLSLFGSTQNGTIFYTCKGCKFPFNGFGFKCTECSSRDEDYSLCVGCASLPCSILHEAHKHPLVLSQHGSNSKGIKCVACSSDVYCAAFTCDECSFAIHGTCAFLPRTIKHRYDELHPFSLLYPISVANVAEGYDLCSQPFCEICEKDVNPKTNEGWLYHCADCDMFGCVECFARDMNLLCHTKTISNV